MERNNRVEEMAEKAKDIIEDECLIGKIVYDCKKCSYREKRFPLCQYWLLAERLIEANYTKKSEDSVVLTKEEYEELEANYDKIYKQAEADIHGNMADGGTSCHWCEDLTKKQTVMQVCDFIKEEVKKLGKEKVVDSFGERPLLFFEAAGKKTKRIKEKFGVGND